MGVNASSEILQLHQLLKEMQYQNYLVVGIVIICFIGGTVLFRYFVSKSIEQAKSDVTKKDISEITDKVEAIKTQFIKEVEHLRSELLFKNTINSLLYADKKEAIIKLYEAVNLWFETIEHHLIDCIEYTNEQFLKAESEIDELERGVTKAESKAELYIADEKLFDTLDKYWHAIHKLGVLTTLLLIDINTNDKDLLFQNETEEMMYKKPKYNEALKKSKPLSDEINNIWTEFRDQCFKHIKNPKT